MIYRRSSSGAPFGGLHFNDSGQAAYTALLSGPGINVTNSVGQFAGAPGDVRMLVRSNDPSPIPGMNWGGSFTISVYQGTPGALAHGVPHRRARAADDAGRDFWSTCITAPTWS